jgi:hypothetical protein
MAGHQLPPAERRRAKLTQAAAEELRPEAVGGSGPLAKKLPFAYAARRLAGHAIRPIMHSWPFGVNWRGRGMQCMWDMHERPRPRARSPIGRICMIARSGDRTATRTCNRSVVGLHNKVRPAGRRSLGVWIAPRPRRSMTPDGRLVLSSCSSWPRGVTRRSLGSRSGSGAGGAGTSGLANEFQAAVSSGSP